ncbi:hypothetical protein BGZ98_003320 [Dissophora globulifera]|nr:hypothetical protein BGZ98_003320 [Dissophora globulifera]
MAFSSKRGSISSNFHSSIITSTIKEEPATSEYPEGSKISATTAHLLSLLNISEERLRSVMTKFKVFQQYSKRQVLLLSLVCLLFGMLMPLDRILHMVGGEDELAGDERGVLVRMREIRMDDTGSGQHGANSADARHDRHSDKEDGIVAQATAFYIAERIAELNDMSIVQQVEVIEGAV